ncbi:Aste57867_21060 [Aphanomyces stellatus]|uniref:Aste57867_21060 protein n=1 Tax=Aphanomyces stellatus TaxID=120398 RepID=A0A485LH97_9STRA|nr:hypothetical protein As57867_020992 [Aphanomyces stellatus]VFT97735.1 Aste57867_21060 [Aphanomyces stellatus]
MPYPIFIVLFAPFALNEDALPRARRTPLVVDADVACTKTSFATMLDNGCVCSPCTLCSYSLLSGCHINAAQATSLSNGSDIPTRQPHLDPSDWFLTDAELTRARGGVPRTGLSAFTANNSVTVFGATNEFFESIFQDLSAVQADAVYLSGWTLDSTEPNVPQSDPSQTVQTVWTHIVQRTAQVHALVFENLQEATSVASAYNWFNGLNLQSQLVLDNRITPITGSLHQKATVIQHRGGAVAYVGGVDHASDRWDTIYHNESTLRNATGVQKDYHGWVDVHSKIVGGASQDILNSFLQRWNDPSPPSIAPLFTNMAQINTTGVNDAPRVITPSTSVPNPALDPMPSKSCGETNILAVRLKAIQNANNFIYVENQYFIHVPDLLDALLVDVVPFGYEAYLYDMVTPLQASFPNKVQIYKTPADIYVHSKVLLVDYVFLSMAANIADTATVTNNNIAVTALAHNFRLAKFGEFTRFSIDFSTLTFVQAADALATYASQAGSFITPYVVEYESYFDMYKNVRVLFDGDASTPSHVADVCRTTDVHIVQLACACREAGFDLNQYPIMQAYNIRDVAENLASERRRINRAMGVVVALLVCLVLSTTAFFIYVRVLKQYMDKRRKAKAPAAAVAPPEADTV